MSGETGRAKVGGRTFWFWAALMIALAFGVGGPSEGRADEAGVPSSEEVVAGEGPAGETKASGEELPAYRIGAGDVLGVMTWKEPDFTLDVLVRLDGKATIPLIGDVQAAGLEPMTLKDEIEKRLSEYIEAPAVTVIVRDTGSQKFYILGEIAKTGEYPLLKDLTVLQAFALAGGFTEWASKKEIMLVRKVDGRQTVSIINYKKILDGEGLESNVQIEADDTIIVP